MMRHERAVGSIVLYVLLATAGGCAATHATAARPDCVQRYHDTEDYYALVEIVDRHIDPQYNGHVSKQDVIKYLGEGVHDPDLYPNAGPNFWVYTSDRPVPYGSYLFVLFGDDGFVKDVDWGSE